MKPILFSLYILLLAFSSINAQDDDQHDARKANEHMLQSSHEDLARVFDSSARDEWQKPDEVIAFLGDIEDKTVVDLGSGSGYFTFRLLATGASVIAADIDRAFLDIIEEKTANFSIEEGKLVLHQMSESRIDLPEASADIIFLVNTYHHIPDRVEYFKAANSVLKEGGKIVIVDFYKHQLPVGPPKHHKIAQDKVLSELADAGYLNVESDTELLEHQYIITAHKF